MFACSRVSIWLHAIGTQNYGTESGGCTNHGQAIRQVFLRKRSWAMDKQAEAAEHMAADRQRLSPDASTPADFSRASTT